MGQDRRSLGRIDFARAPYVVVWEMTLACPLRCRHCRSQPFSVPSPGELTTQEGTRLIDAVAEMGTPRLVLTGGDPSLRSDLEPLLRHARDRGLHVTLNPSASDLLTREKIRDWKRAGLSRVALSLDFPRAGLHDGFRGVPGAFQKTVDAASWANELKLPLQINSCANGETVVHFPELADVVARLGASLWLVFLLVPMGRGRRITGLTPEKCERLFEFLAATDERHSFGVGVSEAPQYYRYLMGCRGGSGRRPGKAEGKRPPDFRALPRAPRMLVAGNGVLSVSHRGEVFPNSFLPLSAGNVRKDELARIYRESALFRTLRDSSLLKGRCGTCLFRPMCGGSRARAYALTGDWLESDPWCSFETQRTAS